MTGEQAVSPVPLLTIFTPTYNRAYCLHRVYESLLLQKDKRFIWLIIDDGSSDNTKTLVDGWCSGDNGFEIRYLYQQNGGMHTAHNTAYENITTELNVCIDSDDRASADAVSRILSFWEMHKSEDVAGIIALNSDMQGNVLGGRIREGVRKATTEEVYYKYKTSGDKKFIYRTEIINSVPEYPVFEGEKYFNLAYKYQLVSLTYQMLVMNEVVCEVEYQPDGSTRNMYLQYYRNPKGFAEARKLNMVHSISWRNRMKSHIHYVSCCIFSHNAHWLAESPRKGLTLLLSPVGVVLNMFVRFKVMPHRKAI